MKKYPWFFFSGIVFSLLVASQSFADELPIQAQKPGQVEPKQKGSAKQPKPMRPANNPNEGAVKGKFRITSRPTGETEQRNFVGIVTEPVPAALAAQLNSMMKAGQGVGVKIVLPNSPAEQAGIKMFDVLTTFNGKAITSSDVLRKFVMESEKESRVKFGVIRASKHQVVEVTLTQKLFRFHKFSVSPVGQKPSQKTNQTQPSKTEPAQDGPIASRSTETGPLGRKLPLGLSQISASATHNLALLYVGSLKEGYSVEVSYQDDNDTLQTHQFQGNLKEISDQIVDMPDHVQMMINERLKELKMALRGKPTFRFQMKGHMQGNARFVRVFLSRGTKDKSVRMVELDHHIGNRPALNVNQIMGNQIFTKELKQLNPTIQQQIRATLQRIRIPTAQVRVDNPI
ncbi:Periplasmic pH-dependent serine endoprotease DegQ precursor [Gimesia alba]|uniref:Periplasmic pH-dependent serine endoprotease DegQ n=1 Tax=Gimesia alba TaxID=2527973 RepID=A0A517RL97_9PLAN|nr:PDZ domain-containing protein [Gimesia alba]QDT44663.1 Periplasmic pH-dependent serine endoprotease DegQ precursor [Gimesia alba]